MKKLRWRLFINFMAQFISVGILMAIAVLLTMFIIIFYISENESKQNYYQALLENIASNTDGSLTHLKMKEGWNDDLAREGIWVQIVNADGKVIDSGNVPHGIPKQYSFYQLEKMKQTEEINGYTLYFYLETFYKTPYLFILGYQDEDAAAFKHIVQNYNDNGMIRKENLNKVEKKLNELNGYLEIHNRNQVLMKLGKAVNQEEKPLDIFFREQSPNVYSTKLLTYEDSNSGNLWVLYTPNNNKKEIQLDHLKEIIYFFGVTGAVMLFITVAISVWNGFRYGNPLYIFTNWLSRMGNEQYDEVLTLKEKKHFYRRNGKIKRRYKLYEEVFQSFYTMAEKLNASKKEREQLEKTREEWMAGISHDLRTPLSTMQGYGVLLESGQYDWSKEELMEIGQTIREKSHYMLNLIEDFSLSFQLKNKHGQIIFEKTEMNQFLKEILINYQRDKTLADYTFQFKGLNQSTFLSINQKLFKRMIDNLIYNAIKHNPKGTIIWVYLEKNQEKNMLTITIEDNGIGMDKETLKHLFTRYYRGTNTDERSDGTGLGMSIAKQIADLHKGMISVQSEKNKGTTVTIQFKYE